MLLNISNHPHTNWQPKQLQAARAYGNIQDLVFPIVSPIATVGEIETLAAQLMEKVHNIQIQSSSPITVHLMGEMTLTYALIRQLHEADIPCIASTTERRVTMTGNSKKTTFKFIQFRPYSRHLNWCY